LALGHILLLAFLLAPATGANAQNYGYGYEYQRQPLQDSVAEFLARQTIYIRPAMGGGFADYQTVSTAVGAISIEVTCPPSRDAIGGDRDRGARVILERTDGYQDASVINTVVGAAQVRARDECQLGVVDSYGMGFVDIYGPLNGAQRVHLWSLRSYALGNWSEIHDIVAEQRAEEERAAAAQAEAAHQAQIQAERQRQATQRAIESRRVSNTFWTWTFILALVGAGVWLFAKSAAAAERERQRRQRELAEQEERAERERRERRAKQESLQRDVQGICKSSLGAFGMIPRSLMSAEELLDTAQKDFEESAFSPFWDAIERAVNKLGEAHSSLQLIESSARRYQELVSALDGAPPPFPVEPDSAKRLVVANTTGDRLKEIVRQGQRNFQFATIYEQRKTNQILVSGFNNLGDAIAGLGDHISASISAVSDRIDEVNRSVQQMDYSLQEAHRNLRDTLSEQHQHDAADWARRDATQAEQARAEAKQAKAALEMLDNIQRGKKPWP
jgi:hypothetical protein